jgi:hypothetical protein
MATAWSTRSNWRIAGERITGATTTEGGALRATRQSTPRPGRRDGEVELLDRQREVGHELRVGRRRADLDALGGLVELTGQAEQLHQRVAGGRECGARRHRRLGLDVDDEPVEVGALLDTGRLDLVGHLEHWRVDGVDRYDADRLARLLVLDR